jgi:FYVE zinc finger
MVSDGDTKRLSIFGFEHNAGTLNLPLFFAYSSCCASRFTWASTSDNEAQEARDKHNCRSCGSLVCEPCSSNRIPIPSIGLTVTVRVCDRCYNDMDGLLTAASEKMRKGASDDRMRPRAFGDPVGEGFADKPIRQRQKRSIVVDELASRVQASKLTCS